MVLNNIIFLNTLVQINVRRPKKEYYFAIAFEISNEMRFSGFLARDMNSQTNIRIVQPFQCRQVPSY